MKSSFCIVVSAVLVSVALVVAANIMCRQQAIKEVVANERESYRYQFIKSEMYRRFTVFDRKTGIVYQYGQSDGEEVSLAVDLPRAGMSFKPFSNFSRTDSADIGISDENFGIVTNALLRVVEDAVNEFRSQNK